MKWKVDFAMRFSMLIALCVIIFSHPQRTCGQTAAPQADKAESLQTCQTSANGVCKSIEQTEAEGRQTDAHVAQMKARTDTPEKYESRTVTDILALPSCPSRCPAKLQPNCGTVCFIDVKSTANLERQAVEIAGELCYINREPDGDIHMEIAGPTDDCPMSIDPFRQLVVEVTPSFEAKHAVWTQLLQQEQSRWLGIDHHPEAVIPSSNPLRRRRANGLILRISGLLLRDTHSEGARSGWEVHPITRIECQRSDGSWVEFSRPEDCAGWHK